MKWYEKARHRMTHPLYRPELKLLLAMLIHVLAALALLVVFPSYLTGFVFGLCISGFLLSAYNTLFD
jgi:type IV secretory pathway TrbL component